MLQRQESAVSLLRSITENTPSAMADRQQGVTRMSTSKFRKLKLRAAPKPTMKIADVRRAAPPPDASSPSSLQIVVFTHGPRLSRCTSAEPYSKRGQRRAGYIPGGVSSRKAITPTIANTVSPIHTRIFGVRVGPPSLPQARIPSTSETTKAARALKPPTQRIASASPKIALVKKIVRRAPTTARSDTINARRAAGTRSMAAWSSGWSGADLFAEDFDPAADAGGVGFDGLYVLQSDVHVAAVARAQVAAEQAADAIFVEGITHHV